MSTLLILEQTLTDIADAIRTKAGTQALICPTDMPQAIADIPSGGDDYIAMMMDGMSSGCDTFDYDNDTTASFPAGSTTPFCKNTYAVANIRFRALTKVNTYFLDHILGLLTLTLDVCTTLDTNSCQYCSALHTVDLKSATAGTIYGGAFGRCRNLDALIIRATSAWTLANAGALNYTKIKDGTGYIYVPRDLVATYQAANNWSTYSAQFRALEDYTDDGTINGNFVHP